MRKGLTAGFALLLAAALQAAVISMPSNTAPLALRGGTGIAMPGAAPSLDETGNVRVNSDTTHQVQNEEQAAMSPLALDNCVAVWRDFRLGYRRVGVGYSTD